MMTQMDTVKQGNGSCNTLENDPIDVRSRHWILTINNYEEGDKTQIKLEKKCKYIFQPEKGENGTPHLQVCLSYKHARTFSSLKNKWPKAHIEAANNVYKCINYCRKKMTRIGEIETNMDLDKVFGRKPKIKDYFIWKPHKWQKEIIDVVKTEPDQRKVYWYWETVGGVGKSALTRHLIIKYGALAVQGSAKDIFCGVTTWCQEHALRTVIIDIPRSQMDHISYKAIEQLKNGFFFNQKYESGMVVFNIPHVIIFANTMPNVEKLSEDRWIIREVC